MASLLNKRKYSDNEKVVLLHFFTNIDKNIYCAKNTLSYQLWSFLVGQYSRSSLSMRDRFLKLFEDEGFKIYLFDEEIMKIVPLDKEKFLQSKTEDKTINLLCKKIRDNN